MLKEWEIEYLSDEDWENFSSEELFHIFNIIDTTYDTLLRTETLDKLSAHPKLPVHVFEYMEKEWLENDIYYNLKALLNNEAMPLDMLLRYLTNNKDFAIRQLAALSKNLPDEVIEKYTNVELFTKQIIEVGCFIVLNPRVTEEKLLEMIQVNHMKMRINSLYNVNFSLNALLDFASGKGISYLLSNTAKSKTGYTDVNIKDYFLMARHSQKILLRSRKEELRKWGYDNLGIDILDLSKEWLYKTLDWKTD